MIRYRVPQSLLAKTFGHFRRCGAGRRECQALWLSPWRGLSTITEVVHPDHSASAVGFLLDDSWINEFWDRLVADEVGVRVQIHTHPGAAYHSATDDAYPLIHSPGFLSLVIPRFGLGPMGLGNAFLAEIQEDGRWAEAPINERLELT